MITVENVKDVFLMIKEEDVKKVINADGDYVAVSLHVFNSGSCVSIESVHYNEDMEQEAQDNGDLFCDKDTFLQLAKNLEINWDV